MGRQVATRSMNNFNADSPMYQTFTTRPGDAPPAQPVRHLTKKEVAERLGVSTRTVEIWTKDRTMLLPVYPGKGRTPKWHSGEFEEWFDRAHRSGTESVASEVPPSQGTDAAEPISEPDVHFPPPTAPARVPEAPRLEPSNAVKRMQARALNLQRTDD